MKSIKEYILESDEKDVVGGHYEDFLDEDTGEVVRVWREDPNPEEEAKKVEQAKKEKEEYFRKVELEKSIQKELDPIEDQIWDFESELKGLKREYRDLQIDHEDEVGQLYAQGKFEEGEKLAQEYGKKFNKLEKQIKDLQNKINKLTPKANNLRKKILDIW